MTPLLIEPFVLWIEGRNREIDDFHFSNRPMAATGLNHDRTHWFYGILMAVQLHVSVSFTLQDEVKLSQFLVIMRFRIH